MRTNPLYAVAAIVVAIVSLSFAFAQEKTNPLGVSEASPDPDKLVVEIEELPTFNRGWQNAMPGEEVARGQKVTRVAITRAEIKFDGEENQAKFMEMIRDTGNRLGKVPNDQAMYDWQMVMVKGNTVRFGVAWYNEKFFVENRDTYLSEMHKSVMAEFGADPEKMRVEHIILQPIKDTALSPKK